MIPTNKDCNGYETVNTISFISFGLGLLVEESNPRKLPEVPDKIYLTKLYRVHLGTDCISRYKSNYIRYLSMKYL